MKFTVYGLNHVARGEFTGIASPGWVLGGSPVVSPGGSIRVTIPDSVAGKEWMQLGNLAVTRPHPDLPLWAGVLDTPWTPALPAAVTIYDIGYLLRLRTPDAPMLATGSAEAILGKMVELANAQEEMFLRIGTVNNINTIAREESIKQTNVWDQLQQFAVRTATEFVTRPALENGRLTTYIDLAGAHGANTNYLLYDGEGGNMTITGATIDGQIYNRVIGVGTQSTAASRLQSDPYVDVDSISRYRLRSLVKQFDVKTSAVLAENTRVALADAKSPYLKMDVKISNHDHVFRLLRLGNIFMTHASALYLPGGQRGWKGWTRLYAMTYNEPDQSVTMTLTGVL